MCCLFIASLWKGTDTKAVCRRVVSGGYKMPVHFVSLPAMVELNG